jgi:hypothetical protein
LNWGVAPVVVECVVPADFEVEELVCPVVCPLLLLPDVECVECVVELEEECDEDFEEEDFGVELAIDAPTATAPHKTKTPIGTIRNRLPIADTRQRTPHSEHPAVRPRATTGPLTQFAHP